MKRIINLPQEDITKIPPTFDKPDAFYKIRTNGNFITKHKDRVSKIKLKKASTNSNLAGSVLENNRGVEYGLNNEWAIFE